MKQSSADLVYYKLVLDYTIWKASQVLELSMDEMHNCDGELFSLISTLT